MNISRLHDSFNVRPSTGWPLCLLMSIMRSLLAGAVLLGASATVWAADTTPIVIPVVTPLSGATSVIGQDTVKSLDIAMQHIAEDGGVLGRKLELKIVDTQGKPDVMRRELERLARLENAPFVLGCEVSAATAAGAQFAEQFKVPYLNSAAAAADILNRGYSWYFSDQITGDDEARAVASFVEHLVSQRAGKPVKFAFLFEDSPRGVLTVDASRKLLKDKGLTPVIEVSYNRAERNLLPQVKKVEQAGPDIVVWAGYTEDVVAGLKAMQQINFTPYVVGVGGGPGDPRIPTLVDPAFVQKLRLSTVDYFNPDLPRAKRFVDAYQKKFGTIPSSYASMCYRGAYTARAVIENALKAPGGRVDRESIRQALRTLKIPGEATIAPFRSIEFDAHGRNIGAQSLVAQWQDGGTRKATVWPKDIASRAPLPLE
ncbi:MAG: ABC transporter substrate-binding protein [Burkholderiales bacterium]|nr:ABC transporter substrate-binding protein [Burkholderiales bacterium]